VSSNPLPTDPRWALAEKVSDAVRVRYPAQVHAIGVHGSLAHPDGGEGSDIELVVVTFRPAHAPRPSSRRIDGVVVDVDVVAAEEYLRGARTLSPAWPVVADRYLTTRALYDPDGWHDRLRDAHLGRLAEAGAGEFAMLARRAWCRAYATYLRGIRLARAHDGGGALLTLGAARFSAALVDGLLSRTYFRSDAEALGRTGLGEANLGELDERLNAQAGELARRGCPVDATVAELLD
jgi:hypothetical protein